MSEKKYPVITISREYGAGGRTVAKGLSEKLGLPWYDQDFVFETARDSGYSPEEIYAEGEELSQSAKFIDFIMNGTSSYNSSHDKIFEAQKKEVLKLGSTPCIIVGRVSNIILREAGIKTFDIFLYADLETKMKRISELKENGKIDLKKYVEKREALRRNYYKHYTKKNLGDYKDYTISIDTGKIGFTETIDFLSSLIENSSN